MTRLKILVSFCFLLFPAISSADLGEADQLLCSVINVVECEAQSGCIASTAEEINIPQFIKADLAGKQLSNAAVKDGARHTAIKNLERNERKIIMQGSENGRGWSIIVANETGKFSATISEQNFGFIIFGSCMEL